MIGEDKLIHFSGCDRPEACTIVLRGASSHLLDEAERSLHDALCVLTQTVRDSRVVLGGGSTKKNEAASNPLSVNSFLWRATLDTLAFMPLLSADPWGGTILTDWYEDPTAKGERFKVNALILDKQLRADNIKITTFRQKKNAKGVWEDASVDPQVARKLEDSVLTRARQLRVKQLGY